MTQQQTGSRTSGRTANPPTPTGTVVAVCLRPEGGVPKHPQDEITIGQYGVEGDYHAGATRTRRGETMPNRRQVSLVAKEVFDDLNRDLGSDIPHGGFGENILVEGLGDLSGLKEGDLLRFSSGVELEVTGQNDPCSNLMVYHNQVPKRAYGRRGVLAVVKATGQVIPGDQVSVENATAG